MVYVREKSNEEENGFERPNGWLLSPILWKTVEETRF